MSAGQGIGEEADKKFAAEFSADIEAALKPIGEKYKMQVSDIAIVVNWVAEQRQKPYPKLIIETMRDPQSPDFDPIRQSLELSELLNMSSMQISRQTLFRTLQDMGQMHQQLEALQNKPKLVIPGQG